jgi:hypothetical protein
MLILFQWYKYLDIVNKLSIYLYIHMAIVGLKNLCTPSYVYLVVSLIALVVIAVQNFGNTDRYCVGHYSCQVSSTILIFIIKLLYILFWTWVLNLICNAGYSGISWFLVLLPLIVFFLLISLLFIS